LGAQLPSFDSISEATFVFNLNPRMKTVRFIGGVRNMTTNEFYWMDGSDNSLLTSTACDNSDSNNFCAFMTGEPNNLNDKENCLQQGHSATTHFPGQINDGNCNLPREFVCERPRKIKCFCIA
jgi:hypothetical protein